MYYVSDGFYNINPERVFDLPCFDGRKSFYGKAKVIECKEGQYLQSYNTLVCFMSYDGKFNRLWDGYSVTTIRHINSFMRFIGLPSLGGKSWWDRLQVWEKRGKRKDYTISELLNI